ncbi:MAG: transglycosylase SLT domain-containing protein [Oscillatoria sp. SIO1A7]|nr:transglycosylase SLT domain-containing protein [Oscillatoria sp. SIO1A7]
MGDSRINPEKNNLALPIALGISTLVVGLAVPVFILGIGGNPLSMSDKKVEDANSPALRLALDKTSEREAPLAEIADGNKSRDRNRARYLLAVDSLEQGNPEAALQRLEGLEKDYKILAPYILLKRAEAYEETGNLEAAKKTWQKLRDRYSDSPVAAEALYALGKTDAKNWQRAIAEYPSHPRTVEIAREQLKQNPNQPELLLLLAKHGLYLPDIVQYLDRLQRQYASQLTPADWETIAFGYWEKQKYDKGGKAYAKAPRTPRHAYRAARGQQIGKKKKEAIAAYKRLIAEFPDSKETALGLLRLSRIVKPQEAVPYLDKILAQFPSHGGEALLERSKVLTALKSTQSAEQARESVLTQYSNSDAAATVRWENAKQRAAAGDFAGAWKWAEELGRENPKSELAPEASFWVGKWAQRLGRGKEATEAFEYVLSKYPESYFAWRSAVYLGWDVGDFTTVRSLSPEVVKPETRPALIAGSEVLQELYQLGQDKDAWTLWQAEFSNRKNPTVAEQFTDGVIRLGVGDNLDGIFMISFLAQREKSEEIAEYEALKQKPAYWQALYPFPYKDLIVKWSGERKLNSLLVTALIRQESRFMRTIESWAGAIGLMQVIPPTGEWMAQRIQLEEYDLENPDDNINLGTEFLSYTHAEYNDNSMLAVASYNAGPGNISSWLKRFGFNDPDEFASKIPFPETNDYVKKVFGNYWNYLRLYNPEVAKQLAELQ